MIHLVIIFDVITARITGDATDCCNSIRGYIGRQGVPARIPAGPLLSRVGICDIIPRVNSPSIPLQSLRGVIERITFYNEENGYTVARLAPENKSYTITVVGNLMGASVGESLLLEGIWTNHPQHGRQFEIKRFSLQLPATIEDMR